MNKLSGGRVGYVYMSDMEQLGLQQFVRQFYAQLDKQALIMDDRWNGGGFIAPFALERLRRHAGRTRDTTARAAPTEPNEMIGGPKMALLNHWSASDGDIFPWLFQRYRPGQAARHTLMGRRARHSRQLAMMDGGYVTIPEERLVHAGQPMGGGEPRRRSRHRGGEPAG